MNTFSMRIAVAAVACSALSLGACLAEEPKKSESKPAETTAAAPEKAEPAPAAEKSAEAPAPAAETKAAAAADKPAEAPAAPAPAAEQAPAAPQAAVADKAEPAPTAAPAAPAPQAEAAAPPAEKPTEVADATPEAKPAEAAPAAAAPAPAAAAPAAADSEDNKAVQDAAAAQGAVFKDGRYRDKDGHPVPVVTKDYKVDWATWQGFRRYHDACHVCHGPNALGSTFAPSLGESLKTMDYETFYGTVVGGRVADRGGTKYVMPSFGEDRNIMCYLDDIYTYIKARSNNMASDGKQGMPAGRPNGREDISPEAKKAAADCTG